MNEQKAPESQQSTAVRGTRDAVLAKAWAGARQGGKWGVSTGRRAHGVARATAERTAQMQDAMRQRDLATAQHQNRAATAALTLGLLAVPFGLLAAIPAVIFGVIGTSRRRLRSRALVGLVLGVVCGVASVLLFVLTWVLVGDLVVALRWLLWVVRVGIWGWRLHGRWEARDGFDRNGDGFDAGDLTSFLRG